MINKNFLDPNQALFRTGLTKGATVVDLGAGSGFFAIAAAKIVGEQGTVEVVDILDSSLDHVMAEARINHIRNIKTYRHDLETGDVAVLGSGKADLVVAANILHQLKKPVQLFQEVYRLLKSGGKLLVIDWNSNPGHFGPAGDGRVSESEIKEWAEKTNLKFLTNIETDKYHYGLTFTK